MDRLKYHFDRVGKIPGTILDIGANKGQWFSQCKETFNCHVHMMEADNDNHNDLKDCQKRYMGQDSITIALLGKEDGITMPFYKIKSDNNTGNSMYRENSSYFKDCNIECLPSMTLDSVIGDMYEKIDLIKLDVQGAELDILRGGQKTVAKCDLILMEVAFQQYNLGAPLAPEVFAYMDSIGFQAIDMLEKHHFGYDFIQADFLFGRKDTAYVSTTFKV